MRFPRGVTYRFLDPIAPSAGLEGLKKGLINYTAPPESELNYKTPTFCHGTSTNSDEYSYKSPKFAGTPQNSFHSENTPQRALPKSEVSSIDRSSREPGKTEKETLEFTGCNCKKSKCLKLYCECFSNEKTCVKGCNCVDCKNNLQNQEMRTKARNSILIKRSGDPKADFSKRGCNCKKSYCRKKYCECYGIGLKCSELCKCEECKNKDPPVSLPKKPAALKEEPPQGGALIAGNLAKKARKVPAESEEKKGKGGGRREESQEAPKRKKRKR